MISPMTWETDLEAARARLAALDPEREIAAAVPAARHEVVEAAAHVAAVERPQTINRLIEEHLT